MKDTFNLDFQQGFENEIPVFKLPLAVRIFKQPFSSNQIEDHKDRDSLDPQNQDLIDGHFNKKEILVLVLGYKPVPKKNERLEFSRNPGVIGFFSKINGLNEKLESSYEIAFSGIVIKKGKRVNKFQIGDEVIGFADISKNSSGSHLKIKETDQVFLKPSDFTFEESVSSLVQTSPHLNLLKRQDPFTSPNSETLILIRRRE